MTPPPSSLSSVCHELNDRITAFLNEEPKTPLLRGVQAQVRVAIGVVEEAFAKYRLDQISISYNGGKDCLVLLIVILACLARRFPAPNATSPSNGNLPNGSAKLPAFPEKLQAVYIIPKDPFPEVNEFVTSTAAEYHLEVARYIMPIRQGLEVYRADYPSIKAIFAGTRRTDPWAENFKHFDPTDAGWPDFMRIHPVIDFHYAEIWAFIRHLGIPYCSLYDQGYTSLGGTGDTHPNPRLKTEGKDGEGFRPAYELTEDEEERLGRDR